MNITKKLDHIKDQEQAKRLHLLPAMDFSMGAREVSTEGESSNAIICA